MVNHLCLRNGRQHIDGGDRGGGRQRELVAAFEHRVVEAVVFVVEDVLVVRRGVDDDLSSVVGLDRPGRAELIEGMEEGGHEMHRDSAQEDEEDIANQTGSSQAAHPALCPQVQGLRGRGRG